MKFLSRIFSALITLSLVTLGATLPASAAELALTFPSGTSQFVAGTWQSVATVTGTTPAITGGTANADIRVTVAAGASGKLRLAVTADVTAPVGFTLSSFDSDSAGASTISFIGKQAKVSAALASLEFNKAAVGDSTIKVDVTEGAGVVVGNNYYEVYAKTNAGYEIYDPDNFANYVGLEWKEAARVAFTLEVASGGAPKCQGYLATITSEAEQTAIEEKVGVATWIGGSDELGLVNHAIDFADNADNTTATYAAQDSAGAVPQADASEGKFFWVFGPDRGSQLSLDNSDGTRDIVAGMSKAAYPNLLVDNPAEDVYQNWASGEPNDYNNGTPGEDAIQLFANGTWNDLPTTGSASLKTFVVEYGGLISSGTKQTDQANVNFENLGHVGTVGDCVPAVATGTKTATFTADVESAPSAPTGAAAASAAGVTTVSWNAPASDGRSPITGYKIEISKDGGAYAVKTANTGNTNRTASFADLSYGSEYRFRISAINAIGTSVASTPSALVTHSGTRPGLVADLSITYINNDSATVSWSTPTDNGGVAVTGFKYQIDLGGGFGDLASTADTSVVVEVSINSSWSFRVAAVNAVGDSDFAIRSHVPAAPYAGPIVTNLAEFETPAETVVEVRGIRLDEVSAASVDGKACVIISKTESSMVIRLPALDDGVKNLVMTWGSGVVTHQDAFFIQTAESSESTDAKVNAGSFKGFVALYAKGYEGKRFSAKVGNDWVIVPSLASNFERIVEYTGSGYEINLRIFIDRVLQKAMVFTTK